MLDRYEKFRLVDEGKNNEFFVEVNWDKNQKTSDCKVLKFTFPDGTESYIKREYLNALLFAVGNEEEQQKMIPQTITRVKWYETVVSVKAKNDIKRGELITFPIKLSLPSLQEEAIAEIKHSIKNNQYA